MNASRWLKIVFALAMLAAARDSRAVTSKSIEEADLNQFSQGELQSVALSSDGYLMPTYARREIGNTGMPIVWDAVRDGRGRLLCATGHNGVLVRIDSRGTTSSLGEFGDSELTAMAALRDGSVLVAGAPSGRIYRVAADDSLTTAATVEASFVWRMAVDARGDVWVATGTEGRLFRLRASRSGAYEVEEICKLRSSNLLDIWIDEKGTMGKPGDIFVAGHDPGWLYRVAPSGENFEVIFNAQAEEIRAIAPMQDGLALALNTERAPTPQAINLTLRMAGGAVAGGPPPQQPPGEGGEQNRNLAQIFAATRAGQFGPPRSEVVILDRKGFVRPLWRSNERPIHALAATPNGTVLAAAGNDGRIFEVQEDGNYSIVVDTRDDFLVRLYRDGDGYMITAARNGVVYRMEDNRTGEAVFLSQALDARLPVMWGQFYLHGDVARGQRVLVSFRHGNDGDVEEGIWSDWTRDVEAAPEQPVKMPAGPARFMQYRLKLNGDGAKAQVPRADRVELFFVEPNLAPLVQNLTVEEVAPAGQPGRPPQRPQPQPGGPQPGQPPPGQPGGAPNQATRIAENNREPRSNTMQVKVTWQAMDPNGDTLRFDLFFRGEEEHPWLLIADEIMLNTMTIDIGGVADGHYRFRVVATDELGNPPGEAMTADDISDEITVDNTAPEIVSLSAAGTARDGRVTLKATVKDALSVLSSLKVDMDNGDAFPILPTDGMMDEREETFEWQTEALKPGTHVATCVATDARGNSSVKKLVFTIEENK